MVKSGIRIQYDVVRIHSDPFTDIEALNAAGAGISDECGNVTLENYQDAPAIGICPITIVRTYTVKDDCGNESTISQNIVIEIADDFTITHVDSVDTVTCFSMVEYASITLPVVQDACGRTIQPVSNTPVALGLDGSTKIVPATILLGRSPITFCCQIL